MRRPIMASVCAIAAAACASQPEDIATSYVSPIQYDGYNCQQVSAEMQRVSRRTGELYGSLEETANGDAVQMGLGLVLFWPALFFLEGGDGPEAQEYARLKGEKDALEKIAVQKQCGTGFTLANVGNAASSKVGVPTSSDPALAPTYQGQLAKARGIQAREEVTRYWMQRIEAIKRGGPHEDCDFAISNPGLNPTDYAECRERNERILTLKKQMDSELRTWELGLARVSTVQEQKPVQPQGPKTLPQQIANEKHPTKEPEADDAAKPEEQLAQQSPTPQTMVSEVTSKPEPVSLVPKGIEVSTTEPPSPPAPPMTRKDQPVPNVASVELKPTASAYRIQLASLKSRLEAEKEWARLRANWPDILGQKEPAIVEKRIADRGLFYRVQITGFSTLQEARSVCAIMHQEKQACFPLKRS